MLDAQQAAIVATLLYGPGHLPADLFAGDDAAVLRGLRVHANTISHARLVALEETYPRTRAHLGAEEFNRLSRAYLHGGSAQRRSLVDIGASFADWLADPLTAGIARAEWAWLESYHAADAPALALSDLAGHDEATLLSLPVRRHPAARTVVLVGDAAAKLDPALPSATAALLITRAMADVRLFPVDAADVAVLAMATEISPLGNLIAFLAEKHPDGGSAIARLIDAGAFEKVET